MLLGEPEITRANWQKYAAPTVNRTLWSAIVPAAGKGSRLGFDRPKILYPVAGRMIIEWLLELLLPRCETIVFVVSPEGKKDVARELGRLAPGRHRIAVQEKPIGMGNAVEIGAKEVTTPHALIVWGDQVALQQASMDAFMTVHEGHLQPALTFPTFMAHSPYIHFQRDSNRKIVRVLQAREGDELPEVGESDAGVFCFRSDDLKALLSGLPQLPSAVGRVTGELNFLPIIPLAVQSGRTVLTPQVLQPGENVGVNDAGDASKAAVFLGSTQA